LRLVAEIRTERKVHARRLGICYEPTNANAHERSLCLVDMLLFKTHCGGQLL